MTANIRSAAHIADPRSVAAVFNPVHVCDHATHNGEQFSEHGSDLNSSLMQGMPSDVPTFDGPLSVGLHHSDPETEPYTVGESDDVDLLFQSSNKRPLDLQCEAESVCTGQSSGSPPFKRRKLDTEVCHLQMDYLQNLNLQNLNLHKNVMLQCLVLGSRRRHRAV